MSGTITDQMTRELGRDCRTIGCRTLEELADETRDRDVVSGPHQRDLPGYGRQYYSYVRMTDAERYRSALNSAEFIKELQKDRGWPVSAIGADYVAEIAADCEALGIPVDFAITDEGVAG